MNMKNSISSVVKIVLLLAMTAAVSAFAQDMHTSSQFQGPKASKGHVTHSTRDGKSVLTLSDDFVDSDGQIYQLDKLKKKSLLGDKFQKEIVLPSYVKNVSKVVIWCAWAEANLGEASFSSPVQ